MNSQTLHFPPLKLALVFPLALVSLISFPSQVQAQLKSTEDSNCIRFTQSALPNPNQQTQLNKSAEDSTCIRFEQPDIPTDGDPTGRRRGGTSRSSEGCPNQLTALVPGEEIVVQPQGGTAPKITSKSFLAFTAAEYPTFWVYVSEFPATVRSAEFVLYKVEEGEEQEVYKTQLMLPEKPGIIGIRLPSNPQYALETEQQYHWYFKVACGNSPKTSGYLYVDAWLQRVALSPDLETQLKSQPSRKYMTYAVNNFWYDAFTHLADLRRTNAENAVLEQHWTQLLTAVGLQDFSQIPIVQHYGLEK